MSPRSYVLLIAAILNLALQNGFLDQVVKPILPGGPRRATIYHESADKTPAFNQMVVGLRSGPESKYLAEKGTDLLILDVTQSAQPDPTLALPSLYVWAGETELYKTTITDVKAPAVLEAIKAHGG